MVTGGQAPALTIKVLLDIFDSDSGVLAVTGFASHNVNLDSVEWERRSGTDGATIAASGTLPLNYDPSPTAATFGTGISGRNADWFIFTAVSAGGQRHSLVLQAPVTSEPEPPVITATPGDAQVTLNWTLPQNNGKPIVAYGVYRDGIGIAIIGVVETYTDLTAHNETTYSYTLQAVNENGSSELSNVAIATPHDVPSVGVPPDIVNGKGAWRMLDWAGIEVIGGIDHAAWKARGWGGYMDSFNFLNGWNGTSDANAFQGSSVLGLTSSRWNHQRTVEGPPQWPAKMHGLGLEAWMHTHYVNNTIDTGNSPSSPPPFGDWWNDSLRDVAVAKFRAWAEFCQFIGMDGIGADTEQGNWNYAYQNNTHTDAQNRVKAYQWGLAIGTAMWQACPSLKQMAYYYPTPGGWWDIMHFSPTGRNPLPRKFSSGRSFTNEFWLGLIEAMATYGNTNSRFIIADADFYKGSTQVAGASYANGLKFETQGGMAWYSRNLPQLVWNKMCDRIDIAGFNWAGTDHIWDATKNNWVAPNSGYRHTGESAFADILNTTYRYSLGTRRVLYSYDGSPARYCYNRTTIVDAQGTHAPGDIRDTTYNQANNWYLLTTPNPPGNHSPGLLAAASQANISTTPPTITQTGKVNNGNDTYTVSGSAFHADGIRCVRGFITSPAARVAAQMTINTHGGETSYVVNGDYDYSDISMDYSLTIAGSAGQTLFLTAVSIHDQEHSIAVVL